jgi:DNA excision repair protein ERCC-3
VFNPANPLIVQSDRTLLLEVDNPRADECRDRLAVFCDLIKSPEHIHTYRMTPLSLWNARAAGMTADEMEATLHVFAKYDVPGNVIADLRDYVGRYGRLKLMREDGALLLRSDDPILMIELLHNRNMQRYVVRQLDGLTIEIPLIERGRIKQALIKIGFPVEDLAGYVEGDRLEFRLRDFALTGALFHVRDYQRSAAEAFWAGGSARGGSGVLVLPCGAGKTIIGMDVMARAQMHTLIIVTSITAVRQWKQELLNKTTLTEDQIGEYSGERKEIRPVTLATYQVLTTRKKSKDGDAGTEEKEDAETRGNGEMGKWGNERPNDPDLGELEGFIHLGLFDRQNWGLIIYDEVHLLPAPVFRVTAEIQARRRLGLTATLVREDRREDDVFSLIGPKKTDIPWKELEKEGWIATALCTEVRVPMTDSTRLEYAVAERREKYRIAASNPRKEEVVFALIRRHRDDNVLVIGQFLDQLEKIADALGAPIITGKTPQKERELLYGQFKTGEIKRLVVSKVANFSIDLPDANVAVQVSGTFGSRQEEAQRLGRILRPKSDGSMARFYTLVTRDTNDQEFAVHRQLFLTEQGYRYEIVDMDEALEWGRQ